MAITINIAGTVIEFPSSDASPDWSPALILFAQAVESALSSFVGPFDVPPQIQTIDAYNPGVNINLQNAAFPTSDVRSVELIYAVYRNTTTTTVYETGTLKAIYSPNNPVTQKWEVMRFGVADALIDFTFLDSGQVVFTTQAISGANHTGSLTFQAKSLLQNT